MPAATGASLPLRAAEVLALEFLAHHLWDPVKREADDGRCMRAEVGDVLRRRRLAAN